MGGSRSTPQEGAAPELVTHLSPAEPICSSSPASKEREIRDADLSEEEGTTPDKPTCAGLFPPALFKPLAAKTSSDFGSQAEVSTAQAQPSSASALFIEHKLGADTIPAFQVFIDTVQWQ